MGDTDTRCEFPTLNLPLPPTVRDDFNPYDLTTYDFNDYDPPCKPTPNVSEREAFDAIVKAILSNPRWRPSGKRRRIAIACVYSTHAGGDMHRDDHAIDATADDLDIKRRLVEELVAWAGAKLEACRTERTGVARCS